MSVQLEAPPFAVFPNRELTYLSSHKRTWASSFPTFQAICHQRLLQIYDSVLQGQAGLVGYFSERTACRYDFELLFWSRDDTQLNSTSRRYLTLLPLTLPNFASDPRGAGAPRSCKIQFTGRCWGQRQLRVTPEHFWTSAFVCKECGNKPSPPELSANKVFHYWSFLLHPSLLSTFT